MKKSLITIAVVSLLALGGLAQADEKGPGGHKDAHDAKPHGHGDTSAVGAPGKAANVTRTITVDMTDAMRFNPASITAKQGETIRFVVKNSGAVRHEFVIGTEKELKEHYELMKKNPEMEHAEPNQITVDPGKSGEVIWQFTKAGKIDFACLQPGHYDAGMKGLVNVAAGKAATESDGHGNHKH